MIPDLTRAVGVPRLAGISYPMGQPLGRPHDADGQRAVLRVTLELLASASRPDAYVELPFKWPESPAQARNASKDLAPPPIVELLKKKPWLLANLYSGRIPHVEAGMANHVKENLDEQTRSECPADDSQAEAGRIQAANRRNHQADG